MNMTFIRWGTTTYVIKVTRPTRKGPRDKGRRRTPQVKLCQIFPTTGTTIKPIKMKTSNNNKVDYTHIFPFSRGEMRNEKEHPLWTATGNAADPSSFRFLGTLADLFFLPQRHKGIYISPAFQPLLEFLTRNFIIFHLPENLFFGHYTKRTCKGNNSNGFLLDCDPQTRQVKAKSNALDTFSPI